MLDGDISDQPSQRLVFVFEGLIGWLDPKDVRGEIRALKRKRWDKAADLWRTDQRQMLGFCNTLAYKWSLNMDLLCVHDMPGFTDAVATRLTEEGWPFARYITTSTALYSSDLAYRPEVALVFHGDRQSPFLFGSRGRAVGGPADILNML